MSNFKCEKCGAIMYDSPNGYVTGCKHYPMEVNSKCKCENCGSRDIAKQIYYDKSRKRQERLICQACMNTKITNGKEKG